ncbi:MAG: hypothetical protein ACI8RD_003316, partial [Bacillariaceae sp.]
DVVVNIKKVSLTIRRFIEILCLLVDVIVKAVVVMPKH